MENRKDLLEIKKRILEIHKTIADDIKNKEDYLKSHNERKAQLESVVFEFEKLYKTLEVLNDKSN